MAQWLINPNRNHEHAGSIPGLDPWLKDLVLLWLWCRPAATAPIPHLAWEPPYAAGAALQIARQKKFIYLKSLKTPLPLQQKVQPRSWILTTHKSTTSLVPTIGTLQ